MVPEISIFLQGSKHGGLLSMSAMVTLMSVKLLNEGETVLPSGVS